MKTSVDQNDTVTWDEAASLFSATQLPEPPLALHRPTKLFRLGEFLYGDWRPTESPYDIDAGVREASTAAPDQSVLFGVVGHGMQSWAMHYILRQGPLLVGLQIASQGAYSNASQGAEALEGAFGLVEEILSTLADPKVAARAPDGHVLTVVDSDFLSNRWAWVPANGDWDAATWEEGAPASFLALASLDTDDD